MEAHKKKKDAMNQAQPPPGGSWLDEAEAVNSAHQKMLDWLRTVKFRRTLAGGVDEADLWRKLEELNRLYEASLVAERAAAEARLQDFEIAADSEFEKYRRAVKAIKAHYDEMAAKNRLLEEQLNEMRAEREDGSPEQGNSPAEREDESPEQGNSPAEQENDTMAQRDNPAGSPDYADRSNSEACKGV